MRNDKFNERLKALLTDIEALNVPPEAAQRTPDCEANSPEKQSAEFDPGTVERRPATAPQRPTPPILYEKEQVGYVYSGETLESLKPSALLAVDTEKAILAPIKEADKSIGAMVIEPPSDRPLSPEDEQLAELIAQRASLQIQNLRLLAAAERARAEAQAATRQYTHESWDAYLDAIHQSERVGFSYDQAAIEPFSDPAPADADLQETVNVLDEQVGRLFLKIDPEHPLTSEDKAIVAAIARQVGQQVENLRLLADAARARAAAEETTRLLSRENWKNYIAGHEASTLGFIYDSNRVLPINETVPPAITYSQPLAVQGQTIGQLGLSGLEDISDQDLTLVSDVATRVSTHLETLRLNEELRKRAAELQELDRLKSSFLANMSHELRTPLNSILGFSDVMLEGIDGPLTDYMQNDLRLIQKNGQHLLHLINDVLDMAKIESGRMNLHPEKFKIQDLFDEVVSITSTLASEKNLSLFIDPQSDKEVVLYADVTRIRQVLINLVNNSIKFTERGNISIKAALLDSARVMITVKDTGIGIPASHLEAIFQEFAQVDTTTTRKAGGTGLGLPISRRLVEMHGGRLWAESSGAAGEGSTFFVELPLEAIITEVIEKTAK